jgi:4-amino-4-deoxy-L-arabinose transferase-like glycosyltransferase
MPPLPTSSPPWPPPVSRRLAVLLVLMFAGLAAALTFHRLGVPDVCGSNEAVEGVFVQQMVEHGELLFPLENARSPMYKPPLFHWTAVALDRVAGIHRVTALNLRSTAALYAILGVGLTVWFACNFLGTLEAALSGLILCASYQYLEQGRIGRVDMTLCFFETLALFSFIWWLMSRPNKPGSNAWRYLFAVAIGLAVLSKGPVGAILPIGACGLFLIIERRFADLRALATPGPLLVAILIGTSWYAACLSGQRFGFLHRQIGSENFGRFFGSLGAMAPWYYVKPILLNSAPLSLLIPFAVYFSLQTFWKDGQGQQPAGQPVSESTQETADSGADSESIPPQGHSGRSLRSEESLLPVYDDRSAACVRLFALFWILTVVFFSVAAYKRRAYLLPLWPASTVMLAWWLGTLARTGAIGRLFRSAVGVTCLVLILFNFFYLPYKAIKDCGSDSYRQTATEINHIVGAGEPLYSFGLGDDPAPLLFYLDRNAPQIEGKLGDAPPGYVIVPAAVWAAHKDEALDLTPVFESTTGARKLLLLRHGKTYATR